MVARSRRAYFANISYVDDKIGEILAALEATRQEAVIVFVSDHGDMLGERGLWFKMNFFEALRPRAADDRRARTCAAPGGCSRSRRST